MNLPTNIISRINPEIQDPISKSVIYTFSTKDVSVDKEGNILYRFPYSANTFWTHFKYTCYNMTLDYEESMDIELILVTTDGYTYDIKSNVNRFTSKTWYDTEWPIPSVMALTATDNAQAGLYFKIQSLPHKCKYNIVISLLGFTELFPSSNYYLLSSPFDTYQFVFSVFDQGQGSIYNVEHYDYIRNIIDKSCNIRSIAYY